ncbi:MAG: HupE/UreJ family protein [Bryobacteraceae bacterium]
MKFGLALLWPATLLAHMVSMSTGELTVSGNRAHYELRMPTYEVAHVQSPERTLLQHIRFTSGGVAGRLLQKDCGDRQGTYLCTADYEFPAVVDDLDIDCTFAAITVPNHVHMLRAYRGDKVDQAVFDVSFTTAQIRFRPPSPWEIAVHESGAGFLRAVGGVAPLLFLASLVLAARSRRELLLLASAFVAGEAVACGLMPRISIALSPRFIEAAAALTIAYLAFEIVLLPQSGQRWLVVGVLGLIHGAYFSLFLTSSGYRFWMFLAGMITGEVLVIAVLAFGVQRLVSLARIPRAIPVAASVLLAVGMVWFFVRLRA